jgi:hypothetical protein
MVLGIGLRIGGHILLFRFFFQYTRLLSTKKCEATSRPLCVGEETEKVMCVCVCVLYDGRFERQRFNASN